VTGAAVTSSSVFQAPQPPHWPDQASASRPHSEHLNDRLAFATG
jgi:hypothetical protein